MRASRDHAGSHGVLTCHGHGRGRVEKDVGHRDGGGEQSRLRGIRRTGLVRAWELGHLAGTRRCVEQGAEGSLQVEGTTVDEGVALEDVIARHLTTA